MALIRRAVSSTLVVLLAVMGLLFACAAIAWPLTPWARVLNATAAASPRDAGIAVAVCLLTFLIGLPLGIIQRVQAGFQEEYLSQLWQGGASLAGMTMVLLLAHFHASFPVFLLLVGLAGPLVMLLNGLAYFGWQRPSVRPRFQEWDRGTARLMLRQGRWFLAVTMITLVAAQVDNLVIAQVQGLASVPTYSIPSKVFTILATVGMMIYQPMWAANGEALARGELQWVRRNTRRVSALGGMLMLAAGAGFIVLARPVFRIWLGPAFEPSFLLMTGMALWTTLLCFIGPYFMVLNGANVIQPQVYRFCAFAIVSIPLKYAAARLLGAWAIPWAAVIPYAAIIVPFALRQSRKILSDEWRGSAQARAARHA
jgi:O-antigen/teichoic acid export membrane protein